MKIRRVLLKAFSIVEIVSQFNNGHAHARQVLIVFINNTGGLILLWFIMEIQHLINDLETLVSLSDKAS